MAIRFTKKTREIIDYISKYDFITSKQCGQIFYSDNKFPIIQAQVKLRNIYESGIIKRFENGSSKELIYCTHNFRELNPHRLYLMNLYAYISSKYEVVRFDIEPSWGISRRRSDGHIIIKKRDGAMIGILVEVDLFHQTSQQKLDELFSSNEVQHLYVNEYNVEGYYPSVLIVNATGNTSLKSKEEYDIVCTDFDFKGLEDIL